MKEHYDIGVVGCWYWGNYGSLLNGYATFQLLKNFGLSPLNIVTPHNEFEPHAKKFMDAVYTEDEMSPVLPFEKVSEYNKVCDIFLSGSDQIWNYYSYNVRFRKYFFLDFADDDKKKISFSTSFGSYENKESEDLRAEFEYLLKRYSSVSVREEAGVEICKERYNVDAVQVMEPVFDIDTKYYYDIASMSEYNETEPYMLTYILDPTPQKREAIQWYSEKLGIKAINILDGFSQGYEDNKNLLNLPNTLPNIWCADFLKYFINADFVITDSFHGTAFSVIFNKPFIALGNIDRGMSRFEALLSKINLLDRFVPDAKNIPLEEHLLNPVDFEYANSVIEKERERTVKWLENALFNNNVIPHPKNPKNLTVQFAIPQSYCMGCAACVSACPTQALELKPDEYGYYRSIINEEKCINCGICKKVCPVVKVPENNNTAEPVCYAYVNSDQETLMKCSSGGAFPAIAEVTLRKNGVVCAAAFNEEFYVEHQFAENKQELEKLYKSKYMQSYMGDTPKKIKEYLDNGRFVLFVGCPCQVAGLKKYLKKDYENLILVDLLCANAPSSKFFQMYLEEKFDKSQIKAYSFRYKINSPAWGHKSVNIAMKNGESVTLHGAADDAYQTGFHNLTMSPTHCRNCKFQGLPRLGDITIGDFWGIEKIDPEIDNSNGVSQILINNPKGEEFIRSIPAIDTKIMKQEPLDEAKKYNNLAYQQRRTWPNNPVREKFYENILKMPFSEAIKSTQLIDMD